MQSTSLLERVGRIVGERYAVGPPEVHEYAVDGVAPQAVALPGSVEELSQLVALAHSEGLAVIVVGGRTKMDLGSIPRRFDLGIQTTRLNRVIDYQPDDLTVTVEAGVRLEELQKRCKEDGLFLPLDPPFPSATLGGIMATNASGPSRLLYGTVRDMILGVRVVQADGVVAKAGGRVVKNVAGYDLKRLHIGALGTLGAIASLSLKLYTLPATRSALLASFPTLAEAEEAAKNILRSAYTPFALELVNPEAAKRIASPSQAYTLIAGVAGVEAAVDAQVSGVEGICSGYGAEDTRVLRDEEYEALWRRVREAPRTLTQPSSVRCKATVLPSKTAALMREAEKICGGRRLGCALASHEGSGVVYAHLYPGEEGVGSVVERLAEAVQELRKAARRWEGGLVVEACPTGLKRRVDVWGPPPGSFPFMRAVKAALDGEGIFNPGRYVGGL